MEEERITCESPVVESIWGFDEGAWVVERLGQIVRLLLGSRWVDGKYSFWHTPTRSSALSGLSTSTGSTPAILAAVGSSIMSSCAISAILAAAGSFIFSSAASKMSTLGLPTYIFMVIFIPGRHPHSCNVGVVNRSLVVIVITVLYVIINIATVAARPIIVILHVGRIVITVGILNLDSCLPDFVMEGTTSSLTSSPDMHSMNDVLRHGERVHRRRRV